MSNYTITTNFGAKDSLPSGNAGKVIKGSEFTTEFTNIQTAIATKADTAGDTFTGVVNFSADVAVNTNTLFVDVSADKVGIGTSSPLADLHVSNGTNSDSTPVEFMIGGSANSVRTGSIVKGTTSGAYDLTLQTSNHATQNQPLIIKLSDATEAMRINSSGNVGIGTNSPATSLHVLNASDTQIRLSQTGEGSYDLGVIDGDKFTINRDGLTNEFVMSAGNVGIGTSSPIDKLDVAGAIRADDIIHVNSTNYARLEIGGDTGAYIDLKTPSSDDFDLRLIHDSAGSKLISPSSDLHFDIGGQLRTIIKSDGKVGIGTASPSSQLHVSSTDSVSITQTHTDGNTVSFKQSGTGGDVEWRNGNGEALILTGSQTRMTVDSSGNVGIGTTSPSAKLEVLATAPTYTNLGTVLWGGTTNNDNHTGISLSSSGDALGGSVGSNLYYSNSSTATQSNTNRSSGEIKIDNTTSTGTSTIRLGGYAKGTTTFDEHMRIDSSGNVGIGETNPSNPLHLKAATNIPALIETTHSNGNSRLRFSTASGTDWSIGGNTNGNFTLFDAVNNNNCFIVEAGATENTLVIDSNSNVGIGTTSPTGDLTISRNGNASGGNIMLGSTTNATNKYAVITSQSYNSSTDTEGFAAIATQGISGTNLVTIGGGIGEVDSATQLRFYTSSTTGTRTGSERMRIDSSGNLLVGKTDESVINTVGIEAHPTGLLVATRDDNIPLIANRKTSDGVVAQFRKDNTVVGTIGCFASDITIGKAGSGLRFEDGTSTIRPHDISTNTANDNAVTLGNSDSRFKDLYLSGGVYLGGTGSANKLTDYEEGTWTMSVSDSASTPNVSSSTNSGCRYIKVGDLVTIEGHLVDINKGSLGSTSLKITGFPFTIKSTGSTRPHGAIQVNHFSGAQVERGLYVQGQANGTHALIKSNVTDTGASSVSASALDSGNTSDIFFSLTYIAE